MARYRLFQRDPITGHMNVVDEYNCVSDSEAARLAGERVEGDGMIICDDELRIVHHFAATVHHEHTATRAA